MKQTTNSRTGRLQAGNVKWADALIKASQVAPTQLGLVRLVADMFDMLADGQKVYMILGATSNLTAYSLTVKGDGTPDPIYAPSLQDLSALAGDLV